MIGDCREIRREQWYSEGRLAWMQHGEAAVCPYPIGSGDARTRWWSGCLDGRTRAHLQHQKQESPA